MINVFGNTLLEEAVEFSHFSTRPDVHLEYALFEESEGNIDKAREIYSHALNMGTHPEQAKSFFFFNIKFNSMFFKKTLCLQINKINTIAPGHVESILRASQLEQRQGCIEAAAAIFDNALSSTKITGTTVQPFIAMQYARFLHQLMRDTSRARAVYKDALQKFPTHKNLWLAAINFETSLIGRAMDSNCFSVESKKQGNGAEEKDAFDRAVELYERAIDNMSSLLPEEDRKEIWHNYLEFLHTFSTSVNMYVFSPPLSICWIHIHAYFALLS